MARIEPAGSQGGERGAFLAELEARKAEVLARVAGPEGLPAARFVFALLQGAARASHTELREDALRALAAREGLDLETTLVPVAGAQPAQGEGPMGGTPLGSLLLQPAASAEQVEALNALFAAGFAAELGPLDAAQRRELTLQVVRLLPGVERLGPFVLSDYVDQACSEEDAVRFWQIYVDRVAAEVRRRTADAPKSREPWLLLDLLRLHEQGPSAGDAGTWSMLKLHMNRALQARRHRWRFVRSFAEGCSDAQLLHFLCTSSAMAEDPEAVSTFLERGDPRLVSCGLFVLQLRSDQGATVDRVLAHFQGRPLPEVGERLVEVHAQACLPRTPAPLLQRLAAGIRVVVQQKVAEGAPVETLLGSVANDPRALRQVILLAASVAPGRPAEWPQQRHLLERVVGVWLQSFTPGGVRHPLNDDTFRAAVGQAGAALLGLEGDLAARLERFALELPALARRWHPQDEAERRRTLSRFLAVLGHTVGRMADGASPAVALQVQALLVRIYVALPPARGSGWFGIVDEALPALYPDLVRGVPTPARITEATGRMAALAASVQPGGAAPGEAAATSTEVDTVAPTSPGDGAVSAPVEVLVAAPSAARTVLGAWLGIEVARWLGRGALRLAGVRRHGEATLVSGSLVVQSATRVGGRPVDDLEDRQAIDQLAGVRVRQRMRYFPVVLGLAVLSAAALLGGHYIFTGLRAGEVGLALPGAALILLGLLFDGAMTHLASLGRRTVVLELFGAGRERPLALQVDTVAGAPFLDAVLAADARRRELDRYARWAAQDETWSGDPASSEGMPEDEVEGLAGPPAVAAEAPPAAVVEAPAIAEAPPAAGVEAPAVAEAPLSAPAELSEGGEAAEGQAGPAADEAAFGAAAVAVGLPGDTGRARS